MHPQATSLLAVVFLLLFLATLSPVQAQEPLLVISLEQVPDGIWVTVVIPPDLVVEPNEHLKVQVVRENSSFIEEFGQRLPVAKSHRSLHFGLPWDWALEPQIIIKGIFREQEIFSQELASDIPQIPKLRSVWWGEALTQIAAYYQDEGRPVTWQEICQLNQLADCDRLQLGQILEIPPGNWPTQGESQQNIWVVPFLTGSVSQSEVWQWDVFVNRRWARTFIQNGQEVPSDPVVANLTMPGECILLSTRVEWQDGFAAWGGTKVCFEGRPGRQLADIWLTRFERESNFPVSFYRGAVFTDPY